MFGPASPFGKPTSSTFGPESAFGQANNANNNPFVVKSFDDTSPFGSPRGGSAFGGTSKGVFGSGFTGTPPGIIFGPASTFGKLTSSTFGPESAFGQAYNANNSPFVAKSFGDTSPFGSPSGGSTFGGTSIGVFGSGFTETPPGVMFGPASPFGKPTSSTFGPESAFGQANNANNSPFVAKSFGDTSPFGSPRGGSAFGGTSKGVFGSGFTGTPPGIIFGPASTFGKPTSSTFGPESAFGQAYNANNSPFVAKSFGDTSPFGSPRGGSAFGGTSKGVFGSGFTGTPPLFPFRPAFGDSSSSTFGGYSPAGQNPALGPFGSTPAQTSHPSQPAYRSSIYGSSTPFGTQSQSCPGTVWFHSRSNSTTEAPIFGSGGAFGASCGSSLSSGSSPGFRPSQAAFRNNQFGSKPHGAHIGNTGSQVAAPTYCRTESGKSSFGGQQRGSRVAPFSPTTDADNGTQPLGKLQSICGMSVPVYQSKSHEELRWEDYQWGDKGGPNQAGQSGGSVGPGASPAIPWPTFSQSFLFSSTTASNAFSSSPCSAAKSNQFSSPSSSNELLMTAPNPSVPNPSSNAGFWPSLNTSPFGCSSSLSSVVRSPLSAFEISAPPSISSSSVSATLGSSPSVISVPTTRSSPLSLSNTPSIAKSNSAFTQTPTSFSETTAPFGQNISPTFGQIHTSSTASSGTGGNLFQSTPLPVLSTSAATIDQTKTSFSLPFQTSEAAETSGFCSLGNLGQTQSAGTGGFGLQNAFGQSHSEQPSISGSPSVVQLAPAVQLLSIGCTGTGFPVQYGISSMPVADKPSPIRKSPLLSARHLSLRQTRLPARIYHPERGVRRVPFFYDEDNMPSKAEANALFSPRGNPRSLFIGPEYWPAREHKPSPSKKTSPCANDGVPKAYFGKASQKIKRVHDDSSLQNDKEYAITEGAGDSAIMYDCGAGIEALMPKLCQPDYYTEPHVKELAAKERAQPGFCCQVKDFVIGRLGYGHIKFVGKTDVRRLDLDSLICFNNREVIVYTDDSKKPPIGQGLNKPAEVTLLNVKCIDKKNGKQYVEGPKVQKYKEMLKKAAEEQGAEFVSYDPMKGEWKFKVCHFS